MNSALSILAIALLISMLVIDRLTTSATARDLLNRREPGCPGSSEAQGIQH